MAKVEGFEDLKIWKEAVRIGVDVYKITSQGALARDYSSKDQVRRAAVSISNNIAEGFEYNHNLSFIRFLKYSKGSAGELRSNLLILKEANLLDPEHYEKLKNDLVKISSGIEALIRYLRNFEGEKKSIGKKAKPS